MQMWVHEAQRAKKWEGQPVTYAQRKLNGWRATMFKQADGKVIIFGRDLRPHLEFIGRFPRLAEHRDVVLFRENAPPTSSLDGEFTTDSAVCSDVVTAFGDPKAPLEFTAFGVPVLKGQDLRKYDLKTAEQIATRDFGIPFATFYPVTRMIGPVEAKLRGQAFEEARQTLLNARGDFEGWVLKEKAQYGKWYKVKPADPVDCIITGVIPGEGKFANMVGAIIVSVYNRSGNLQEIASTSGMTDAERAKMTALHKDDMLRGLVVQVKYQYVGNGGRLVHPRFGGWRPDKPYKECTIDQLDP